MLINYVNVENLLAVMNYYSLKVFTGRTTMDKRSEFKNHDLNIVNIRNDDPNADKFDDIQVVFWKNTLQTWLIEIFPVTTDPGVPHLLKPLNKKGTAIVCPGQYRGVWKLGLHKGKYEALVQNAPIMVVRDWNEDSILDAPTYTYVLAHNIHEDYEREGKIGSHVEYKIDIGYFGINCHRASSWKILDKVGLYSAGCCVHQNPILYQRFIDICKAGASKWGNSFTATWLTETDFFNALSVSNPELLPIR